MEIPPRLYDSCDCCRKMLVNVIFFLSIKKSAEAVLVCSGTGVLSIEAEKKQTRQRRGEQSSHCNTSLDLPASRLLMPVVPANAVENVWCKFLMELCLVSNHYITRNVRCCFYFSSFSTYQFAAYLACKLIQLATNSSLAAFKFERKKEGEKSRPHQDL